MKRQLLTLAIILAYLSVFSQSDLRPGYVVLHSGDSLKGTIVYKEGKSAFIKCDFKQLNQQGMVSYVPQQILGYGFVNDRSFVSKFILTNQDSTKVFLEELVRGLVSLYKFEGRYFVQRAEGKLFELTDVEKLVYVQDKGMMSKRNHEYRGIINSLIYDCNKLKDRIEKLKLTQKELTIIVEDYNRCTGSISQSPKEKKSWMKTTIQLQAGLNLSTLKGEDKQLNYLAGKYETSLSIVAGGAFNFSFQRINEKLSLYTEILYLSSSYNKPITKQNHMTAEVKQFKVPFGMRYTFNEKRLAPFIGTGLSYSFHVKKEGAYVSGSYEIDQTSKLKNDQIGFWAGTGISSPLSSKLKGSVEIRYELTDGIYKTKSKVNNLQLIFGLRIK